MDTAQDHLVILNIYIHKKKKQNYSSLINAISRSRYYVTAIYKVCTLMINILHLLQSKKQIYNRFSVEYDF